MQPSARLTATIKLLSEVEAGIVAGGAPADRLVKDYFRARRYAGAKDRRAITDHVYGVLRARALYLWALEAAMCRVNARALLICHLHQHAPEELAQFGGAGDHSSPPLSAKEEQLVATLASLDWQAAPKAARHNIPEWIAGRLEARFAEDFEIAAAALNTKAPLDIRVNALQVNHIHLKNILNNDSEHFKKHYILNSDIAPLVPSTWAEPKRTNLVWSKFRMKRRRSRRRLWMPVQVIRS